MTMWRWFVGQVTRLRRSIAHVIAPSAGQAGERVASADEPAGGPPEHWVERVRQGAPGLLEPSLRRRDEPAGPPAAERVMPSQTELEPLPDSLEEPPREHVPPEPRVGPARPAASPLRKVLRRRRSQSTVPPTPVHASHAPTADDMQRELHAATRPVTEPAGSRAGEAPSRRRSLDDTEPTPTRSSPPEAEQPKRSSQAGEVIELEPPAQRPIAREEQAASPDRPVRADVARPSVENLPRAERAVDETRTDRVWERAVTPIRESPAERLREASSPTSRQDPSLEPGPPPRNRTEPLSAVEHPWPELPPALDQADGDLEAALRAWEHQRRIDHEQMRL